ncbi:hypothetical protein [uncultured Cellulomonas sp.]|uniref:hypothetical protein n=1 Tax=uncultured Cellulomonas sp. TaxID=189682 RepID=UPI002601C613|nr:hypothetical protein [uncultured Cellulomonas sp.]
MTSGPRRRATTALAVLAVLLVGPAPGAAAATTSDDAFTVLGAGGWLAEHRSERWEPPAPFEAWVDDSDRDRVQIHARLPGGAAELTLIAPADRPLLTVGRHTVTGQEREDVLRLRFARDARGCSSHPGVIDVLELSRGPAGRLTGLALDYVFTCDNEGAPTAGSIRWNSDVPYHHTAVTGLRVPGTAAGEAVRGAVTLTNAGGLPQTLGRSVWEPQGSVLAEQASLAVRRDGCVGVVLQPGDSCQVEVSVHADGVHGVAGHLRTPDATLRGAAYSPITMPVPPEPVRAAAVPQRGGVLLLTSRPNASYRVLRSAGGGGEVEVAHDVPMPWTDTDVSTGVVYTYRVVVVDGGAQSTPSDPVVTGPLPEPVGEDGRFVAVDPVRVLDTRDGTGGHRGALGPGASLAMDPGGPGQVVPRGVRAVLLNVTATEPTAVTHVRVWPAGDPMTGTSSLNVVPGQTRPNQVVVPVGEDGRVSLYNNLGTTHLVADLQGYYVGPQGQHGGGYHPTRPVRVSDTREERWPLQPGETVRLPMDAPGVVWNEVVAVEVNLTVTGPTEHGHVTAWSGESAAPVVSHANFAPGQTVANHAVVPVSLDEDGQPGIAVRNSAGLTHLVVDVTGWYDDGTRADGLRFRPVPTSRVADSRVAGSRSEGAAVAAGEALVVPGTSMPPGVAQVVNVTATGSSGGGHATAWSGVGELPLTSTLNFAAGEDSPNLATVLPALGGAVTVTVGTWGTHLVVDHLGFFY